MESLERSHHSLPLKKSFPLHSLPLTQCLVFTANLREVATNYRFADLTMPTIAQAVSLYNSHIIAITVFYDDVFVMYCHLLSN